MSHASDATKAWVSAVPKKNADGNVIEWSVNINTLKATIHIHLKNLKRLTHHLKHLVAILKLSY
jgi:hypothetical protein